MAKPRISRSASAAPRSPATVEKRTKSEQYQWVFIYQLGLELYLVTEWLFCHLLMNELLLDNYYPLCKK
jgi:hypothetical protein